MFVAAHSLSSHRHMDGKTHLHRVYIRTCHDIQTPGNEMGKYSGGDSDDAIRSELEQIEFQIDSIEES